MSERSTPIVPHVLAIGVQCHPWRLGQLARLRAIYHTPTTVRVEIAELRGGKVATDSKQHYHVWCLPDEAAWERAQAERAAFQAAIDTLATEVRRLGRYADRLTEAGGAARAPNPLTPTVIYAPDPDHTPKNWTTTRPLPQITRRVAISHTAKLLRCQGYHPETEVPHHQRDHFVCPTDADWEQILALHRGAQEAEKKWKDLLHRLGTYFGALADGRYRQPVTIPRLDMRVPIVETPAPLPSHPPNWPQLAAPLFYGHHRNAGAGGIVHAWRPEPRPRSKQRHQAVCAIVQTETPTTPDWSAHPRLCGDCRRKLTAATQTQEQPMIPKEEQPMTPVAIWHNLPPKLAGYAWIGEQRNAAYPPIAQLRAPDGWTSGEYELSNHAIAEALRRVNNQALAVVAPIALSVVMMDQAEARETLAAMRGDLDQIDRTLSGFRQRALEFADRQGWRALGYGGALEAINAELGTQYSKSYLSRLLGAARIERLFELPMGNSGNEVPERVLREFGALDTPDQQKAAWQAATFAAGGTTPTVSQARQAAAEIKPPPRPNAPAGWVWRDNNSMRRIADSAIVGPYAQLADVVSAAEQIDDADHIGAARKLLREAPKWSESEQARLYQEAYAEARQVRNLATRDALFAEIDAALDRAKEATPPPPEPRGQRLGPGQPEVAPWPDPPEGWRWNRRGAPAHLIAPDGWTTHDYNYPERALAEAERRILSMPKTPAPAPRLPGVPDLPPVPWSTAEEIAEAEDRNPAPQVVVSPARNELLIRPQRPPVGDVSAVLQYQRDLEAYVAADDDRRLTAVLRELISDPDLFLRQARTLITLLDAEGGATLAEVVRGIVRRLGGETTPPAPHAWGVYAALKRANELAGDDLAALAAELDDATYEALAAYRRAKQAAPALEASV